MRRILRGRFALFVSAVAAVAVSGCASAGVQPVEVVRAAATKTASADTSRVAFSARLSGGALTGTVRGTGVFDYSARRGQLTIDLGDLAGSPFSGSIEAVVDSTTIYLRFPAALGAMLAGGKQWVKLDLGAAGREMGIDLGQLTEAGRSDPTQALEYLRGASDRVRTVGRDTLRGVDTTHYEVTIDLHKAAAAAPAPVRARVEKAVEALGTSTLPADVWIDGAGRLRKMAWTQTSPPAGGGSPRAASPGALRTELELYDFGVDATVSPPPPGQTVDLADLLGSLRRVAPVTAAPGA